MPLGQSADKSYAYLLGVFLGDGCVTKAPPRYLVFRLNTIDEDFALATKQAISDLSDRPVNICKHAVKKSSKPNFSLRFGQQDVCQRLMNDTNKKQVIPEYVFTWDVNLKKQFIVGLMDSEGFVGMSRNNPTNRRFYMGFKSCDVWVPDFMRLIQSVGLRYGKTQTEKPYKEGYKAPTRFTIKMQSWVDSGMRFNIKRKQERVDLWASAGAYENRSKFPRKLVSETARQAALCG